MLDSGSFISRNLKYVRCAMTIGRGTDVWADCRFSYHTGVDCLGNLPVQPVCHFMFPKTCFLYSRHRKCCFTLEGFGVHHQMPLHFLQQWLDSILVRLEETSFCVIYLFFYLFPTYMYPRIFISFCTVLASAACHTECACVHQSLQVHPGFKTMLLLFHIRLLKGNVPFSSTKRW